MAYIGKNPKVNTQTYTPQSVEPTNPFTGMVYNDDGTNRDAGLYRFDGVNWVALAGGTSGINYLENYQNTSNWTVSDAIDLQISENTTDPQRGTSDLKITKASTQDGENEYASYAFEIDRADRGKVLPVKADYITGANVLDDDFEIVIYDVTNAATITVTNAPIKESASGGLSSRLEQVYFQTATDSVNYELRITVKRNTTDELTLTLDNMLIGPEGIEASTTTAQIPAHIRLTSEQGQVVPGLVETKVIYNTIKDQLGNISANTSTGDITINEPGLYMLSFAVRISSGDLSFANIFVDRGGTLISFDSSGSSDSLSLAATVTVRLQVGDVVTYRAFSNAGGGMTLTNSDNGTHASISRIDDLTALNSPAEAVAARYTTDSGQVITDNNVIVYEDINFDTHNAMNTTTGEYTVPLSGKYYIKATYQTNQVTASSTNTVIGMAIAVNGTDISDERNPALETGNVFRRSSISDVLNLTVGDVITIVCKENNGPSMSLSASSLLNYFSISKSGS